MATLYALIMVVFAIVSAGLAIARMVYEHFLTNESRARQRLLSLPCIVNDSTIVTRRDGAAGGGGGDQYLVVDYTFDDKQYYWASLMSTPRSWQAEWISASDDGNTTTSTPPKEGAPAVVECSHALDEFPWSCPGVWLTYTGMRVTGMPEHQDALNAAAGPMGDFYGGTLSLDELAAIYTVNGCSAPGQFVVVRPPLRRKVFDLTDAQVADFSSIGDAIDGGLTRVNKMRREVELKSVLCEDISAVTRPLALRC